MGVFLDIHSLRERWGLLKPSVKDKLIERDKGRLVSTEHHGGIQR